MDTPQFSINFDPSRALLSCAGELDLAATPELEAALLLLEAGDGEVIGVDASRVTLVSCCCLRALDGSRRRLEKTGRRFEVVAASPPFVCVAGLAQYRRLAEVAPSHRTVWWRLPQRVPAVVAGWLERR